jgi:hypothetical protein
MDLCERCIRTKSASIFRECFTYPLRGTEENLSKCLALAIKAGDKEMIQVLVDLGADPLSNPVLKEAMRQGSEALQRLWGIASQPRRVMPRIGAPILKLLLLDTLENAEKLGNMLERGAVDLV